LYYNFGLIGYPLTHTLSPLIHNYLIYKSNINGGYTCFELNDLEGLESLLNFLKKYNFFGLNVTLPYKEMIIDYVSEMSEEAEKCRSVNTLYIKDGNIKGYNTDLYGFRKLLECNNVEVKEKTVVILGAGGAAKSVLTVLLEKKVKKIYLLSRDIEKGRSLINTLDISDVNNICVNFISMLKDGIDCDIVINATSAGIKGPFDIDLSNLRVNFCAIDLQYKLNHFTNFLQALDNRVKLRIDGMEMLIYQAIKSFEIWTNLNIHINFKEIKERLLRRNEITRNFTE
jgi:shikimate dehydrogenase